MKSLYEMICMLYATVEHQVIIHSICIEICGLKLDKEEIDIFITYFKTQRPREDLHREFYLHNRYQPLSVSYWWDNSHSEESTEQRRLFIKKLMNEEFNT